MSRTQRIVDARDAVGVEKPLWASARRRMDLLEAGHVISGSVGGVAAGGRVRLRGGQGRLGAGGGPWRGYGRGLLARRLRGVHLVQLARHAHLQELDNRNRNTFSL